MLDKSENIDVDFEHGVPFLILFARVYTGREMFPDKEYRTAWTALSLLAIGYAIYAVYYYILFSEKVLFNSMRMTMSVWLCVFIFALTAGIWK